MGGPVVLGTGPDCGCRRPYGMKRIQLTRLAAIIVPIVACSLPPVTGAGETLLPLADDISGLFRLYLSAGSEPALLGGHGFVVETPTSGSVALTAHHVGGAVPIGPDAPGGISAYLQTPAAPTLTVRLGERFVIPGARTIDRSSSQADVAAFRIVDTERTAGRALQFADRRPPVGDTVWVLAVHLTIPSNFDPRAGPRRHPARVEVSHDSAFIYSYLESYNANLTSGAAVLDRDGRVVGINVGTLTATAATWESWRNRYGACCERARSGVVVGLAVNTASVKALLSRAR